MIVRNESRIIERCLESVYKHIDTFVICDTGSTDSTVSLIKSFFSQHGIAGTVYEDEWIDFSTNRNMCLNRAQMCQTDFCLMVDADELLEVNDMHWTAKLQMNSVYNIDTGTRDFVYAVPVLTPTSMRDARYVGVTHEYLEVPEGTCQQRLQGIRLLHIGDGGHKDNKLERDKHLLKQALRTESIMGLRERYMFYLAQTCFDMKDFENAIFYYRQRIKYGGWDEEVFYSYYKCALALLRMNGGMCTDKVVRWFFRAWQFRPTRLEPLFVIMKTCSDKKVAKTLGQLGRPVKMTPDILFVEKHIYEKSYDDVFEQLTAETS